MEVSKGFLVRHSPQEKYAVAARPLQAVGERTDNPTLNAVAHWYGGGVVADWLKIQFAHTFGLCGFTYTLDAETVLDDCAETFAARCGASRLGEVMLFLARFETGDFGADIGRIFDKRKFFRAYDDFVRGMRWSLKVREQTALLQKTAQN